MLKKLSLAALVAMGSMSVASATDLSEAIKGVDFGGYVRLRAYHDNNGNAPMTNRYRTTAAFQFTMPVSEDVKFKTNYALDWSIYSDGTTSNDIASGSTPTNVHMFLQYSKDNLTVLAGKIPVATPVTGSGVGEALGAGAIALYKVNDGLTVAAAGIDSLVNTNLNPTIDGKNVYAVAAIVGGNLQVWGFKVDDVINRDVVVTADLPVNSDIKLHLDYASADLDDSVNKYIQTYKNINATINSGDVCVKVGFAANGKNGATVVLDTDAPIASAFATEQITGIANGKKGDKALYTKIGYKMDPKTDVYVAYTKTDDAGKEALIGAKYAYTKKMGVKVYYSITSQDNHNGNKEARAEFKYSF